MAVAEHDAESHGVVRLGLAFFPEPAFVAAALPLLGAGLVETLQLTVDAFPAADALPPPLDALLRAFGGARLSLHAVSSSPFGPEPETFPAVCATARRLTEVYGACRVSEHVGFASGPLHLRLPPLPPPGRATEALAIERLRALGHATGLPVGLENLAFAFDRHDADAEPDAMARVLEAIDGFLLLDLHNLHCRAQNLGLDPVALLARYPLHRLREVHVAGGRDEPTLSGTVRRDTHDGPVPDAVLALLENLLARTDGPLDVFVERVPSAFTTLEDAVAYQRDVERTRAVIARTRRAVTPHEAGVPGAPVDAGACLERCLEPCVEVERGLAEALDGAADLPSLRTRLAADPRLDPLRARLAAAPDAMLETARRLVARWAVRRPVG